MKKFLKQNIINLADKFSSPLYIVGGFVRNFLIDGNPSVDVDLAGAIPIELLKKELPSCGFSVHSEYKRTQTLLFTDGQQKYEYTAFREEEYEKGGFHTPKTVTFTDDIFTDAKRRDFKCNAVYYDIKAEEFVDPLGGAQDIKDKILDTVVAPQEVFSHDGLRLMRLARFVGELNFKPTKQVLESAKNNAKNVLDVSKERVFAELKTLLVADGKYSFSNKRGHYEALKILDETRVLDYIFPDLTKGRNMEQRKDYHNYDVLEHSLRAVLYAPKDIRLYALLHDIGKPFAMNKDGKYYNHAKYGESLTKTALESISADKKTLETAVFITKYHMLDKNLEMGEEKIRLFIVDNYDKIDLLLKMMQADFMAYKDSCERAKTVVKWENIICKMKAEKVPFCIKDLNITAKNLIDLGLKGDKISKTLNKLLRHCILNPKENKLEKLIKLVDSNV